jgi:cyanophycinase-like exopeptidase
VTLGPLVLAGSGEYTPAMDLVDNHLLEVAAGKPVILIATSCAMEGEDVMAKWEQMGVEHFLRLGMEARPIRIKDQADANVAANAEPIAEARFVWFSGGSPTYLAQSFHDTLAWRALEAANRHGAVVAGASGGLGVLNADIPSLQPDALAGPTGLGLADPIRAMAHFDRAEVRRPEFVQRVLDNLLPGQVAAGVDEDTTLTWMDGAWRVIGHKRVVIFDGAERKIYHHGDVITTLPPPTRTLLSKAESK